MFFERVQFCEVARCSNLLKMHLIGFFENFAYDENISLYLFICFYLRISVYQAPPQCENAYLKSIVKTLEWYMFLFKVKCEDNRTTRKTLFCAVFFVLINSSKISWTYSILEHILVLSVRIRHWFCVLIGTYSWTYFGTIPISCIKRQFRNH